MRWYLTAMTVACAVLAIASMDRAARTESVASAVSVLFLMLMTIVSAVLLGGYLR